MVIFEELNKENQEIMKKCTRLNALVLKVNEYGDVSAKIALSRGSCAVFVSRGWDPVEREFKTQKYFEETWGSFGLDAPDSSGDMLQAEKYLEEVYQDLRKGEEAWKWI